ncbi:hypothetical protein ACFFH4_13200 [Halalkalibacter alkalisediminis]|uniref:Uncharacterized protein n=1 Tax=Halalkalibacter alkalisediminis TaxID=935616 RepID=A0ABV6NGW9_9BACI
MSISLGGSKKGVAYWMTGSLVAWSVLLAVLAQPVVVHPYPR